jgi:hypothetical protein
MKHCKNMPISFISAGRYKYYNCDICCLDIYIVTNICYKCVGKYYLVDSGYANKKGFLSPYKGEKYHLPEF